MISSYATLNSEVQHHHQQVYITIKKTVPTLFPIFYKQISDFLIKADESKKLFKYYFILLLYSIKLARSSLKLQTRNKRRENVLSVTAMLRLQTSTVTQRQTAGWLSYSSVNVFLDITDNRYMLGI